MFLERLIETPPHRSVVAYVVSVFRVLSTFVFQFPLNLLQHCWLLRKVIYLQLKYSRNSLQSRKKGTGLYPADFRFSSLLHLCLPRSDFHGELLPYGFLQLDFNAQVEEKKTLYLDS